MSNNSLIAVLALAALIGGLACYAASRPAPAPVSVGGASQDESFQKNFLAGAFVASLQDVDNTISTLSASPSAATSTARTLTAKEVCETTVVSMAFGNSTGTLTFPSAANLVTNGACLQKDGAMKTVVVRNASSSSTGFITYAAGASSSIVIGRDSLKATTTANNVARFTLFRITSSSAPWIQIFEDAY
jgi:hypothetical protein